MENLVGHTLIPPRFSNKKGFFPINKEFSIDEEG